MATNSLSNLGVNPISLVMDLARSYKDYLLVRKRALMSEVAFIEKHPSTNDDQQKHLMQRRRSLLQEVGEIDRQLGLTPRHVKEDRKRRRKRT